MERRKRTRAGLAVAAAAAVTMGMVAAAPAQASTPRRLLPGSAPAWLAHASALGAVSASGSVNVRVYLAANGGQAALKSAVAAISTPGSGSYRHFLTPAQYRARFQPTNAAVAQVSSWLTSAGLRVNGVEASHRYVSATGTVASAESAFGTTIRRFAHDKQVVQAPTGAISVPDSFASQVLAVSGLDTTVHLMKPAAIPPPPSFVNARPCSIFYGQVQAKYQADYKTRLPKFNGTTPNYAVCGYTPAQFRAAYEGATPLDGTGVTVAVLDAYESTTLLKDANRYAGNHGEPAFAPGQFSTVGAAPYTHVSECDASGWFGEQSLDIEAVHGMAPGAKVRYYAASSCYDQGLGDALNRVVDDNRASVVTNSWGKAEEAATAELIAAYQQTFLQGAMQGITFMFSSGDSGDEVANTGLKQADWPTSDPYVTSVGGTSTAIGATGGLLFQTGWGTAKYGLATVPSGSNWQLLFPFLYGAGGGYSALYNRPAYQNGVVPAGSPAGRALPDVAMDADPTTGMLIGLTQTFPDGVHYGEYRLGGTSLASPLFAGMEALGLQHLHGRLGFANPTIYQQVAGHAGTFIDVRNVHQGDGNVRVDYANLNDPTDGLVYSVRTFDQDSSLNVSKGWDDVTGVGVPAPGFLTSLK